MNETTKNFLETDPVATAERLFGKHHEEWDMLDGMVALQIAADINDGKRKHLKEIGDTHFGISWAEFIDIAKDMGFEEGWTHSFVGKDSFGGPDVNEEEIIFFHKEKGLILYAESYNRFEHVNSAKIYGEIKIGEKLSDEQWDALHGCSHGSNGDGTMHFDVDVREGFRHHINAISETFKFVPNWTKAPFIWFLNYMDTKDDDYDYEKINQEKIRACKPEVSKIIYNR